MKGFEEKKDLILRGNKFNNMQPWKLRIHSYKFASGVPVLDVLLSVRYEACDHALVYLEGFIWYKLRASREGSWLRFQVPCSSNKYLPTYLRYVPPGLLSLIEPLHCNSGWKLQLCYFNIHHRPSAPELRWPNMRRGLLVSNSRYDTREPSCDLYSIVWYQRQCHYPMYR